MRKSNNSLSDKKNKQLFSRHSFLLSPLFVATAVFLFFQLQVFNLGISWRDEGFLMNNALRITHGGIPYKDFFMTTTPAAFYIEALFLKLFGSYLIIDRLVYIAVVIGILYFAVRVYQLVKPYSFLYLLSIALLFVAPGGFGFYNTEGVLGALISYYFFLKGYGKTNTKYLFFSGLFAGVLLLLKQSYGIWFIFSLCLILVIQFYGRREILFHP
jgi:hypothetical protein